MKDDDEELDEMSRQNRKVHKKKENKKLTNPLSPVKVKIVVWCWCVQL